MSAYSSIVLSELHVHPVSASLAASQRAAERYAQTQALREAADATPQPVRLPVTRRLLALVRRPQRTTA